MKLMAVAASLLVILSLATAASAHEKDPVDPGNDPVGSAGALIDEARDASQRVLDEHMPDASPGANGDQDADGGEDDGRGPLGVPDSESLLCGRAQVKVGDCPEQGAEADPAQAAQDHVDAELDWLLATLPNEPQPEGAPDAKTLKEAPRGLAAALEAFFEPVQEAGAAATRILTTTAQGAGLILHQANAMAEAQIAQVQAELAAIGDKFFNMVIGQAPFSNAPSDRGGSVEVQSVAEPTTATRATGLAMAAVGGLGLAAGALWVLRRIVGLGSISLLSRIPSKDIMKNDTRAAIFDIVQNDPGTSLNEIVSRLGISRNAVAYHLAVFESESTVVSVKDGKYRRYFVNGGKYVNGAKDVVSTIKNDVTLNVIRYILDNPGSIQKEVCQAVGTSPSATNWHITRLEKVGLVAKEKVANTVRYSPGPSVAKYDLGEFGLVSPLAA